MENNYFGLFVDDIPLSQLEIAETYLGDLNVSEKDKRAWKPEESASRTRSIYKRWKKTTEELLYQILLAYLLLRDQKNEYKLSFTEWCKMADLPDANLVRKWILRYLDPEKYSAIVEEKRKKVEASVVKKTIDPIIKDMKIAVVAVKKDAVDLKITVFGKEYRRRVSR